MIRIAALIFLLAAPIASASSNRADAEAQAHASAINAPTVILDDDSEKKRPENASAAAISGACAKGISANTGIFSAAIASGNPLCDFEIAQHMAIRAENHELAAELAIEAAEIARFRNNKVKRFFSMLTFGLIF